MQRSSYIYAALNQSPSDPLKTAEKRLDPLISNNFLVRPARGDRRHTTTRVKTFTAFN